MSETSPPKLFTKLGFDPAYLPAFEDKLFLEGPQTARRLTNYFALLLLLCQLVNLNVPFTMRTTPLAYPAMSYVLRGNGLQGILPKMKPMMSWEIRTISTGKFISVTRSTIGVATRCDRAL